MMNDAVRNLLGIGAGLLLLIWVAAGLARIVAARNKQGGPPDGTG